MKALLCLISAQLIPNLLSVHHFHPDRLVLVETEKMKAMSGQLLTALKVGGLNYENSHEICPLEGEGNLAKVRACLQACVDKFSDVDAWIVNITGGTKLMSIAAYDVFRGLQSARLIYVDEKKPADLIDVGRGFTETCRHVLSAEAFLAAYGFEFGCSSEKVHEKSKRASEWWDAARCVAEHMPDKNLLKLDRDAWNALRKNGGELTPENFAEWSSEVRGALVPLFGLREDGGLSGKVDKYAGEFLTGEWLEVFMWGLLKRHEKTLGLSSVLYGVNVRKVGQAKNKQATSNMDVIFMYNHALHVVECKSGEQQHLAESEGPNAPLDKIVSRTQQFGALKVQTHLAVASEVIYEKEQRGERPAVKESFKALADVLRTNILSLHDVRELARCPNDAPKVAEKFMPKK